MTTATIDLLVHPFYGMGLIPPYYDSKEGAYAAVQGLATSRLLEVSMARGRLSIEKAAFLMRETQKTSEEYRDAMAFLWRERIKRMPRQEYAYMGLLCSEPHPEITPHQEALAQFAQTELGDRIVVGNYGDAEFYNQMAQRIRGHKEAVIYAFGEVSDRCVTTEGRALSEKLTEAGIQNDLMCDPILCADLREGKENLMGVYRAIKARAEAWP